jgi:hypothetical protein
MLIGTFHNIADKTFDNNILNSNFTKVNPYKHNGLALINHAH